MKQRLDQALVLRGLVATRSQAESYIRLGDVLVDGKKAAKPGMMVDDNHDLKVTVKEQFVNRAALKLASVMDALKLDFNNKIMLDVGSSTGGFTEFALKRGAKKVIAVDVGTNQLHPSLQGNPKIELHEQTDIRDFHTDQVIDIVVADVSFISLREILPNVIKLTNKNTEIVAMVKPQFEVGNSKLKHKGVIKNDKMRRDILRDFEAWARRYFIIENKADSKIAGSKGNLERFYLLKKL